ncbi:MAG: hypothetical protein ABMB14_07690, partial [Myxococcota bacterium]
MRAPRVFLVLFLASGVVFGYASGVASLIHGDDGWRHHCHHGDDRGDERGDDRGDDRGADRGDDRDHGRDHDRGDRRDEPASA